MHQQYAEQQMLVRFSALQRAEIAEIFRLYVYVCGDDSRFSALQRAEIAEINSNDDRVGAGDEFQCSSTSRNC